MTRKPRPLQGGEPYIPQIIVGRIIKCGTSCRIFPITGWNNDDHSLAGTRQKNSISILEVILPLRLLYTIPAISDKGPMLPTCGCVSEIGVPCDASPIKLKPLHMKFRRNILKVI